MSSKKSSKVRKLRKHRRTPKFVADALSIYDILSTHDLQLEQVTAAVTAVYLGLFRRLELVIAKQRTVNSWDFLKGSYIQATELYVVASLAYYKYDLSLMDDAQYDSLCKFLHKHYKDIPLTERTEQQLSRDLLNAGSGYVYADTEKFRTLRYYDKLLKTLSTAKETTSDERPRTRNKPRLLRKKPVRRKPNNPSRAGRKVQ